MRNGSAGAGSGGRAALRRKTSAPDGLLKPVADALVSSVGETDLVYRIGGDEFLVLFAGQSVEESRESAERVRAAVGEVCTRSPFDSVGAGVSVGMVSVEQPGDKVKTPTEVFQAVDALLYRDTREREQQSSP